MLLCINIHLFTTTGHGTLSGATLSGFPDQDQLTNDSKNSATVDSINSSIRHWIFPSMKILCDVEITGLNFSGVITSELELYPDLTVWSQNQSNPGTYLYEGERSLSNVTARDANQTLLLAAFDPPLPVNAGYIVGLHYPVPGNISVQPDFLNLGMDGANDSFYITFNASIIDTGSGSTLNDQYLPLILPILKSKDSCCQYYYLSSYIYHHCSDLEVLHGIQLCTYRFEDKVKWEWPQCIYVRLARARIIDRNKVVPSSAVCILHIPSLY